MATTEELRAVQRAIVDALGQHQSWLYRASSGVVNRIHEEIDRLAKRLVADLAPMLDDLAPAEREAFLAGRYTTDRLKALRATIDGWGSALNEAVTGVWGPAAQALAGYEAGHVAAVIGEVIDGPPIKVPSAQALYRRAALKPLMGEHVERMIKGFSADTTQRVYVTVRQGMASGQTTAEIMRALRGTTELRGEDGLIFAAKRDVERLVRTARNHIADVASDEVYEALGAPYVVRVASLEGRTCKSCAALDGKVYKRDEPRPPATLHPNCRCRYAPSFDGEMVGNRPFMRALKVKKRDGTDRFRSLGDMTKKQREAAGLQTGQVAAGTTYADWFGRQDAAFQREWLGEARYRLYRDGKYELTRFIDPKNGKTYTLEELRRRDAQTFRNVFGE
ncbi:minor capsid protein [Orrella sp. JC864]|uniref:minor capsid protein n=1 Tax=Orrella sp. JC864 TaxID=3120298 RepID=UPI0030091A0F